MLPYDTSNTCSGSTPTRCAPVNSTFVIVFDSKKHAAKKKAARKPRSKGTDCEPLAFIHTTTYAKSTPDDRQLIRTHVMYNYWQKHITGKHRNHELEVENQRSKYLPRPPEPLVSTPPFLCGPLDGPDPFCRLPIKMQPFMYKILNHCKLQLPGTELIKLGSKKAYCCLVIHHTMHETCSRTEEHNKNLKLCPRSVYFTRGLSDAAIFRSLLCTSALHMDVLLGQGISTQRYILKKDAVRTISERLSHSKWGTSDETITAVALLAIEEGVSLNFINWTSHMKGLQQIVTLRGGISKLDKVTQIIIHVADLHGCNGTTVNLSFPWSKESTCRYSTARLMRPPPVVNNCNFHTVIDFFDEHLLATFSVVRSLTIAMNQALENKIAIDILKVEAAIIWIQSRLLASNITKATIEQKKTNELCCLGIQIYQVTITNYLSLKIGTDIDIPKLLLRLKDCLNGIDTKTVQHSYLFLWAVFVGGIVPQNIGSRSWFIAQIHKVAEVLKFRDWDSVRLTLTSFLWTGKLHDEPGRRLWYAVIRETSPTNSKKTPSRPI